MEYVKSLLFEWQNAVFAASIAFWLVYLFISLISGGPGDHMEGPADHDLDHDIDHHDINLSHEGAPNKDFSHSSSVHGWGYSILSYLGLGRCPLSIVLMLLGVTWGFIGLVCNGIFDSLVIIPAILYFWASAFVALLLAVPFTSWVSKIVANIMPRKGTTAISLDSLIGKSGETSVTTDAAGGRAKVLDEHGTLHNIYCKTTQEETPIPPNTEVLVLSRLPENGLFLVKRKPQPIVRE
jgi:hypothetical protein